jgi:hypothetical protein
MAGMFDDCLIEEEYKPQFVKLADVDDVENLD